MEESCKAGGISHWLPSGEKPQLDGQPWKVGDTTACPVCGEVFELVAIGPWKGTAAKHITLSWAHPDDIYRGEIAS